MFAAAVDRVDVLDPHVKGPDLVPAFPRIPAYTEPIAPAPTMVIFTVVSCDGVSS